MDKVLIIDDSMFQRKVLGGMIEKLGYDVVMVSNGEEGLALIESEKFTCIFMDLLMPVMTGMQVLEKLGDRANQFPIVILSADIQHTVKDKCIKLGASDFLHKPPKKEELKHCIEQVKTMH